VSSFVTGEKTTVRSEKEYEIPISENTTQMMKGHFPIIIITKKVKTKRWLW
jgi:hypothetical protein